MTNTTQTILLLESGDLEVYEGKELQPEDFNPESNDYQLYWNNRLSTKRTVKMAQGEYDNVAYYLNNIMRVDWITGVSPIDVSDIVYIGADGLGYFKEPVREGESQEDMLVELLDMRNNERSITYILKHFKLTRHRK